MLRHDDGNRVLVLRPDDPPQVRRITAMTSLIGGAEGEQQSVFIPPNLRLVGNLYWTSLDLEPNLPATAIAGRPVRGTVLALRLSEEGYPLDLTDSDVEKLTQTVEVAVSSGRVYLSKVPFRLYWAKSEIRGYGIFADEAIPKEAAVYTTSSAPGLIRPSEYGTGYAALAISRDPHGAWTNSFNFGIDPKRPREQTARRLGYSPNTPTANLSIEERLDAAGTAIEAQRKTLRDISAGEELLMISTASLRAYEHGRRRIEEQVAQLIRQSLSQRS
jgi:hypothetical protein